MVDGVGRFFGERTGGWFWPTEKAFEKARGVVEEREEREFEWEWDDDFHDGVVAVVVDMLVKVINNTITVPVVTS